MQHQTAMPNARHSKSPSKDSVRHYGTTHTVPEEKLRLWAEEAFSSGLGGRGIMKKLQTALDEQIFEDPCRDMYSGVDQ